MKLVHRACHVRARSEFTFVCVAAFLCAASTYIQEKKAAMSSSCRNGSPMTHGDARRISQLITPAYKHARKRMHSPERSPVQPTASRHLHYVSQTNTCVGEDRASKRKLVSSLAGATGAGNKILLRDEGAYHTSRFVGFMFIGPALIQTTGSAWRVMDTLSACAIECRSSRRYMPHATHLSYEASTTGGRNWRDGVLLSVAVTSTLPCLRRVANRDGMVVDHWAPHERLIYAQSNGAQSTFSFVASVDYKDCISCVYCGDQFGKNTRGLCEHLNLRGRLLNTRFLTK